MTASTRHTEKELLARIAGGDEAAFSELFTRYRGTVYTYIFRVTKSHEISEDIVVDIFMKFWLGRELFANVENLEGLLRTVAHNKALDFLRTAARQEKLKSAFAKLATDAEKGPHELLIDQETKQILLEAVNQLPPQRKVIYQLSREQGLTHEEIAAALGLSRSTVKNTIMAANRSIAEFLQNKYGRNAALGFAYLLFS